MPYFKTFHGAEQQIKQCSIFCEVIVSGLGVISAEFLHIFSTFNNLFEYFE
jgi:hypothetical protein